MLKSLRAQCKSNLEGKGLELRGNILEKFANQLASSFPSPHISPTSTNKIQTTLALRWRAQAKFSEQASSRERRKLPECVLTLAMPWTRVWSTYIPLHRRLLTLIQWQGDSRPSHIVWPKWMVCKSDGDYMVKRIYGQEEEGYVPIYFF